MQVSPTLCASWARSPTLFVLVGDIAKGVIACLIGSHLMGALGVLIAGSAAIVGHMFPLYFGFKGGKGILVGATMIAVFDWRVFCVAIAAFIVLVALPSGCRSARLWEAVWCRL